MSTNMKPADQEKQHRLIEKLKRELGYTIMGALNDNDIIEVMLNPDGHVWFDSLSKDMYETNEVIDPMRAYNIVGTAASIRKKNC